MKSDNKTFKIFSWANIKKKGEGKQFSGAIFKIFVLIFNNLNNIQIMIFHIKFLQNQIIYKYFLNCRVWGAGGPNL